MTEFTVAGLDPTFPAVDEAPDDRLFIAALEKGLRVLEVLRAGPSRSLGELASLTGYGKSAVQRLIYTLVHLGYVRKDASGRRYHLTSKLLLMGSGQVSTARLVRDAYRHLVSLNERTSETSLLSIVEGAEIVVLLSVPGRFVDSPNVRAGMRFSIESASSGLAVVATWDDAEIDNLRLEPGVDRAQFKRAAQRARKQGFCVTESAIVSGHVSVSAPVLDQQGRAIAALNLSTLATRTSKKLAATTLGPMLRQAADALSAELAA